MYYMHECMYTWSRGKACRNSCESSGDITKLLSHSTQNRSSSSYLLAWSNKLMILFATYGPSYRSNTVAITLPFCERILRVLLNIYYISNFNFFFLDVDLLLIFNKVSFLFCSISFGYWLHSRLESKGYF